MKKLILLLALLYVFFISSAQTDSFKIENNTIARTFYFLKDTVGFYTQGLTNNAAKQNYVNPATEEFNININGISVDGRNCKYISHSFQQNGDQQTLTVNLQTPLNKVYIQLIYEVYADLPLVRKQLKVINQGTADLTLAELDVEKLRFQVVDKFSNEVYCNYGANLMRIPYKGDYNDAAVMLFNATAKQGVIFGNEAPSVLKNTEIYTNIHGCIQIGMHHINETFPFKKWLQTSDTFTSPKTFIYVFNSDKWQYGFEGEYKEFIRKYLGVSLYKHSTVPLFFYDTWRPFLDTLDEKLIKECTDKLASIETDLFIIDAGWYKYSGDFIPDSSKFPDGMKSVSDFLHNKGLQIGLWFPAAGVNAKSKIATQHPEWLIKDKAGISANLHDMSIAKDGVGWSYALKIMSLGSPYSEYLKNFVSNYIRELGISYVKFDLSIVCSAYVHDTARTGDYETNSSKLYQDRASSYWSIYEGIIKLMDEIHAEFPDILIDCTYETWGRYNIVDYALIEHGDYDWLTNFELESPAGPISIRQINYDRSRVIPTPTMLMGNQFINASDYKYVYFSLASSSLVMLGDPRKLTEEHQTFYKKWNNYLKQMESKYQYTHYYQLYDIFDRPTDNNWDGCYRINTEKQGGLMFFYRNNSSDVQRTFKVPCLQPQNRYKIYSFETGKTLGIFNGKTLIEKGITVTIPTTYTAEVLTIEKE